MDNGLEVSVMVTAQWSTQMELSIAGLGSQANLMDMEDLRCKMVPSTKDNFRLEEPMARACNKSNQVLCILVILLQIEGMVLVKQMMRKGTNIKAPFLRVSLKDLARRNGAMEHSMRDGGSTVGFTGMAIM